MQHFLLGVSGSGKSYEANVFHILPALKRGRKVITNLPVDVDHYATIDPAFRELLEVRKTPQPVRGTWTPTDEAGAYNLWPDGETKAPKHQRVFGGVWDYYDTWKDKKGGGPLYVIDECQYPLPRGETDREVEEWFALHRHFNADVLLITQSYRKVSQAIGDNVQMVYRCRKNVALGSDKTYVRKVQDGTRGEVVNTSIRKYEPAYFKLYRSHTQGEAAKEASASDIKPLWQHWSILGSVAMFLIFAVIVATGNFKLPWMQEDRVKPVKVLSHKPATRDENRKPLQVASVAPAASQPAAPPEPEGPPEPFDKKGLHLLGSIGEGSRALYLFVVSQNGQQVSTVDSRQLVQAGYTWQPLAHCVGYLKFHGRTRSVTCDLPTVGPSIPANVPTT